MKHFTIIRQSDDFICCLGIARNYNEAVGIAYTAASDIIDKDEGLITPLYELEGDTGMGLAIHWKGRTDPTNIFILDYEGEEEGEHDNGYCKVN